MRFGEKWPQVVGSSLGKKIGNDKRYGTAPAYSGDPTFR